jgi:uncharacterized delta-60 repeat protein
MKKTLLILFFIICNNLIVAQNSNTQSASSICGNGIVEAGEECDGTPGCTSGCTLIPTGTFFVEPSYGVQYITNNDPALKSSVRSLKLNTATNIMELAVNRYFIPYNFSFGGSNIIYQDGTNAQDIYITSSNGGTNLNKNFPMPIIGDDYVGNLLGEGTNLKGIQIRNLANPYIVHTTIIPSDIGENDFDIFAAATQPDGKILLAGRCITSLGRMIIIRLNANYTLDGTFNTTGYVKLTFGSDCQARAIGVQSTGKIIVAGHRTSPGSQAIVARLTTFGTLDTTFGNNGYNNFYFEVNTQNNFYSLSDVSEVYSIHITNSDNIYLCGTGSTTALWNGKSIPTFRGYTSNGTSWIGMNDLTHTTATSLFNVDGSAYKILVNADESFYLGGFSTETNNKGLYLQRFDSAGNVDANFNFKTGSTHAFYDLSPNDDIIYDMVKQNDGKILIVGEGNYYGFYTRIMDTSLNTRSFELKSESIILAPNPVSNSLNLLFENEINGKVKIVIVDVLGKEVYSNSNPVFSSQKNIVINDLDALSNGIYFLKIQSDNKTKNLKFIKE